MDINLSTVIDSASKMLLHYGPRFVGAILVLIVGLYVIKLLTKGFSKALERSKVDITLVPFLRALVNIALKILLVISVLSMVGIAMTSFIAILGAAGLAVGMALSGTLQNFAGGIMILLFKPFKNGDFIEAQGHAGIVNEIQIFNTILKTVDNKTIIIPNGALSNSSMINYSSEKLRRVDFKYGIGYGDKTEKAKQVLLQIISEDSRILQEPTPPLVEVLALSSSSVDFAVRVWCKAEDYWDIFYRMNERVYNEFNAQGISIPFPQMDVHVIENK